MAGFTKLLNGVSHYREIWTERNSLHVAAIEQAGFLRNLDLNSTPSKHIELKFPEYVPSHGAPGSY